MKEFRKAKRHIEVSTGESVRILRELQELSQNQLAGDTSMCRWPSRIRENIRVAVHHDGRDYFRWLSDARRLGQKG